MHTIQVLDCTLRDGGYCNDCHFGYDNQIKIVNGLVEASLDSIECGFFRDDIIYDRDYTRFSALEQIAEIIPANREGKLFVALADHGRFDAEALPPYDGTSIDGLRIAFHKKDRLAGLQDCLVVKEKGYQVFVQAMVSAAYSDEEFLDLIRRVNDIEPYAFYIVDSFGMMKNKDLNRLFLMMEQEQAFVYDEAYIEALYTQYMTTGQVQESHATDLKARLADQTVLLIAPGKSSFEEKDKIISLASQENVIVVSVNFDYTPCVTDFIFLSNLRRFRELDESLRKKCIVTSNIPAHQVYLQTKYTDLINDIPAVKDNAGLMAMNEGMAYMLAKYAKSCTIQFLTKERFLSL